MKQYYIMSQKKEKNVLTHLRGIKAVLVNSIDEVDDENMNIQSFEDIREAKEVLYFASTYFNKFNFSIRGAVSDSYIVSKIFLDLLLEFNVRLRNVFDLTIVDINNRENRLVGEYYLVFFDEVSFWNVLDTERSKFYQEFPVTIDGVNQLVLKDNIKENFIIIEELNSNLKTPICSELFKKSYLNKKLRGIDFFEIETAPWMPEDTLQFYFENLESASNKIFIEPV